MATVAMEDLEYKESTGEEGGLAPPSIEGLEVSLISTILVDEACLLAQLAGLHLEVETNYVTGSFSLQQTLPMQGMGWYSEHSFNSVVTFVLNTVLSTRVTTPLKQLF